MKITNTAIMMMLLIPIANPITPSDYASIIMPDDITHPQFVWNILESPDVAFAWGWTEQRAWIAEENSKMTFEVTQVKDYVEGIFSIGNLTLLANDTDVARELVFGVWGLTPFFPGLIVPTGRGAISQLNETAYDSAARVQGNYLNGTIESRFENLTIGSTSYECIIFDYEQDPPSYGDPQRTYLAYSLSTGLLVRGNTSYSFGTPYNLVVELEASRDVYQPVVYIAAGLTITAFLGIITFYTRRKRV